MESMTITLPPELAAEYEDKLVKLKAIIAEGDEQLHNGDCGPYSLEDLNRDCADTISD